MTAILAAMDNELKAVVSAMTDSTQETLGSARIYRGAFAGKEIVAAKTGIGKSLSAIVTQAVIERFKPDAVVYIGIAGSLNPEYDIGDVVVARDCIQHDIDLISQGFKLGEIPFEGIREIPCDPGLVEAALRWRGEGVRVHSGRILTGDRFVVDQAHSAVLRDVLEGDAVEMEGASAGLAALMNDIPFLLVRVISDKSDGELPGDFKGFVRDASKTLLSIVTHILKIRP